MPRPHVVTDSPLLPRSVSIASPAVIGSFHQCAAPQMRRRLPPAPDSGCPRGGHSFRRIHGGSRRCVGNGFRETVDATLDAGSTCSTMRIKQSRMETRGLADEGGCICPPHRESPLSLGPIIGCQRPIIVAHRSTISSSGPLGVRAPAITCRLATALPSVSGRPGRRWHCLRSAGAPLIGSQRRSTKLTCDACIAMLKLKMNLRIRWAATSVMRRRCGMTAH